MAETCEFANVEFEIEEQIIIGGKSSKIRKRDLRDPTFDLKAMLTEGRRDEQSTFQTKEIESKETKDGEMHRLEQQHRNNNPNSKSNCKNCGREFPHKGSMVNVQCEAKHATIAANKIISLRSVEQNKHQLEHQENLKNIHTTGVKISEH